MILAAGILSERVQHDSISAVAFKFQGRHHFRIFKFDVQDFGLVLRGPTCAHIRQRVGLMDANVSPGSSKPLARADGRASAGKLDKFSGVLVEFSSTFF